MPNIAIPIQDLYDSVERPVLLTIIRQVMDITRISSKTNIRFLGDENKAAQQNSTIDISISENKWNYDERISMEVDEDFDYTKILSTAVQRPEHLLIFNDPNLHVAIKPVYSKSKITITVKYKARDKNQAMTWRNQIRAKTSTMRDINLHSVNYSYHLPEVFQTILQEIHRLREQVDGYGENYNEYFTKYLTPNASIITNLSGDKGIWSVAEKQIRITGWFDWEGAPEKGGKEDDHDTWDIGFSYNFSYDKPIECNINYPIMIHNQLLSEKYRPDTNAYKIENSVQSRSLSSTAFGKFEGDTKSILSMPTDGICIPSFDEFYPSSILPTTVRVVTALSNITPADKRLLFNLKDLGDFVLDKDILQFLSESEYPYLGKDFQSILSLSLYRENDLMNTKSITVDQNLNISSATDLSLRNTYRVRLGLVTDLSYLPVLALIRLRRYPLAAAKLLKAIDAAIRTFGGHRDIKKNKLSLNDRSILEGILPAEFGRGSNMNLVQILFVEAFKNIKE